MLIVEKLNDEPSSTKFTEKVPFEWYFKSVGLVNFIQTKFKFL